jgi:hypothetical protein
MSSVLRLPFFVLRYCLLLLVTGTGLAAQDLMMPLDKGYRLPSRVDAAGATEYRWTENGNEIPNSNTPFLQVAGKSEIGDYVYIRQANFPDCGWVSAPAVTVRVTCTFDNFNPNPSAPAGYTWSVIDTREGEKMYTVTKQTDGFHTSIMMLGTTCKAGWPAVATSGVNATYTKGACVIADDGAYYYNIPAMYQFADCADTLNVADATQNTSPAAQGICPAGWYVRHAYYNGGCWCSSFDRLFLDANGNVDTMGGSAPACHQSSVTCSGIFTVKSCGGSARDYNAAAYATMYCYKKL